MKKVAIIGLGPMGIRHIQACRNSKELDLAGGADLNVARVEELISDGFLPSGGGFSDYKQMIVELKPDIVVISTNAPSHYDIFHEVVNLGVKNILCEKPIATSIEQAINMIETASLYDVLLLVNHSRRWCLDYVELKSLLEIGEIGKVESVTFSMGGGQMGCNGMHIFDLISYLTGARVDKLIGFLNDEGVENPRGKHFFDPGGYALVHLDCGIRVYFEMTEDLGIPPLLIINGTYGRVTIEETKKRMTVEKRASEDCELPVTRYGTPLKHVTEHFFEHLDIVELTRVGLENLAKGEILADPSDALKALEVVIAIHASHEMGNKMIMLPINENHTIEKVFSFT
ncbi:putative dehydrogenase [Paenibacillus taihuensis]|uniref:Putative dehydrogenase n=2 Tax=Paenibacillus taihuensis TaxID=1156355 RepID=A0A3D9RYI6_9BACL|nr:putative dehydrogenase [Paenibacillus taihuensis]